MSGARAQAAIEAVVRDSYGRLVAFLAARSGDIAGAEDALGDALCAALQRWPADGVPQQPEAWLLHAARNRQIDAFRSAEARKRVELAHRIAVEAEHVAQAPVAFPDERLKLLFVCAHPAVDPAARTPLMLQTVLGLDATRIAAAFLVSPAAMEQRLVRAKTKIREAGIAFRVPEPPEWDERASYVLDAIYSAFNAGWTTVLEVGSTNQALATEALAVGRMLVRLLPEEPEAQGLLSLMLHCEARRTARRTGDGAFVPLHDQDPELWSRSMIVEAEEHLRAASKFRRPGRYQLEAAIHSLHAHRASSGVVDWREIALLYEGLVRLAPSIGAQVGRAVALAESGDAMTALAALDAIPANRRTNYQPWWAARAHVLRRLGRRAESCQALERAASLTDDPALRTYLLARATR